MADRILDYLFRVEGWPAFTSTLGDRGGATKGGITLATLAAFRGRQVTEADLLALTQEEAARIYRKLFIADPHYDQIADELLRFQVVDAGVLSGPRRATEWLQTVAGAIPDGVLGPKSLTTVNATSAHRLGIAFAAMRIRFLAALVERDRTQAQWVSGWMVRATLFLGFESERAV